MSSQKCDFIKKKCLREPASKNPLIFNFFLGAYVLSGGPLKNDSKIKVNYLLKRLKQ